MKKRSFSAAIICALLSSSALAVSIVIAELEFPRIVQPVWINTVLEAKDGLATFEADARGLYREPGQKCPAPDSFVVFIERAVSADREIDAELLSCKRWPANTRWWNCEVLESSGVDKVAQKIMAKFQQHRPSRRSRQMTRLSLARANKGTTCWGCRYTGTIYGILQRLYS